MDFRNNDDLEERSLLMQIDENASQEGLESNSEENGSCKEKSSGDDNCYASIFCTWQVYFYHTFYI